MLLVTDQQARGAVLRREGSSAPGQLRASPAGTGMINPGALVWFSPHRDGGGSGPAERLQLTLDYNSEGSRGGLARGFVLFVGILLL